MNRLYLLLLLSLLFRPDVKSQALRDNNFSYLYHPDEPFALTTLCYHHSGKQYFYFSFQLKIPRNINEFQFGAELRESAGAKEGTPLPEPEWLRQTESTRSGRIVLPPEAAGKLVALRITMASARKPWWAVTSVPAQKTYALLKDSLPVTEKFILLNQPVTFAGFEPTKPLIISVYDTEFPAAAPPFSRGQLAVPPVIKPVEVFSHPATAPLRFSKKGLVLVQQDTTLAEGLAFRVEDDYPRYTTLNSLAGPFIYICEKKEIDRLRAAVDNKPEFDKVVLNILGDAGRAKIFMRNYFQRVEQANTLFTSYKEGWKTDRGMMYIIFGPPDEVYLLENREVWEYKKTTHKGRFTFVRAATLFDANNFVLLRDATYRDTWYNVVDLWRKGRF
jgi:GWxTD domain-containing protein